MALKIADRVRETTTTTGTGTINLGGAVTNFETFAANLSNSDTTYYAIVDNTNGDFEVGLGTFSTGSPNTLARTTPISSSNSNSAVNFGAGTKDVFITTPASKMAFLDASGNLISTGGTSLMEVANDTSPSLGGDLDVNGNELVSTSNGNIALSPNGTGVVRIDGSNGIDMQSGAISIKNSGAQSYVRFYCESSNAHYAQLQAPAHSDFSGNTTLTLPATTDTIVGKATTDTLTNKTLTSPVIETVTGSTITLDSAGDITLDAGGADVTLKDDGTTFGSLTNSSGELVIKSGSTPTTAVTFSGANVTFAGNLTVNGTTTTIDTTNTTVKDTLLGLNSGATSNANDCGIIIERGSTGNDALFIWDESADKFALGTTTDNASSTGNLNMTTGTLVANVEGNVTGTIQTAAQSNITSLGTLTTLTVDNVIINGTTIGHTDDTDLMTVADGVLTVAGEVSMTTLDIGGTNVTATAAELNHVDGVTSNVQTQLDAKATKGFATAMAIAL